MPSILTGLALGIATALASVSQDGATIVSTPTVSTSVDSENSDKITHTRLVSMIGPKLEKSDGSTISTKAFLADKKYVLLYFSAGWCPPCRMFTPDLVKFAKENEKAEDFAVILVGADRSTDAQQKYMAKYKMEFPAVPLQKAGNVKRTYAGGGIPNLVILDAKDAPIKGSYETKGKYTPKNRSSYIGPQPVLKAFQTMRTKPQG